MTAGTETFERHESQVRVYCRRYPVVFELAQGHVVWAEDGTRYLDLLSGAGALNYGHNHPAIARAVRDYLLDGGIVHSLDLHTVAKRRFLDRLHDVVLAPRGMDHRVVFTGPTGTNAVEAALKIARRVTGRTAVVAFTNGFHGLSLGALAASANPWKRGGAGVPLDHVVRLPYDGFLGPVDTMDVVERMVEDPGGGIDPPAAFLVETVQGEGGLHTASAEWLRRLAALARRVGALLVVDDIQAGCGRTGSFLSTDGTGVVPDVVCLSKSLSGLGLPMAVALVASEHDVLRPGEHSGTFRGNNLAFAGAAAALDLWDDPAFVARAARLAESFAARLDGRYDGATVRGRGLIRGLAWDDATVAGEVSAAAFRRGLLVETAGPRGEVLKLMPPLTIGDADLDEALDLLDAALAEVTA